MRREIGFMFCMAVAVFIVSGCGNRKTQSTEPAKEQKAGVSGKHQNDSLAPKKGEAVNFKLVANGQPAVKILLSDDSSTIDDKAASMLKDALDKGTGLDFKIVKESSYTGGSVISLGETVLYKKSGIKPKIDLDAEGYMIAEKNGNLFLIGGRKRGSISPAIALIEEDLGGRLYAAIDGLQMPELAETVTVSLREYVPQILVRTMFQYESFDAEFQLFNRVGTSDSGREKVPAKWGGFTALPKEFFVHTCDKLLPNELYFDKHPEYFSLVGGRRIKQGHGGGGHLCWTNPDVRKIVTARVLKELKTYYPYGLFDISPNDSSGGFCQCDKCQAIAKREGSEAGPLLDFINYVAGEVKKEYPHVKITTLAYAESKTPPKNLRPADNVIIRLANELSAHYPMFSIDDNDEFLPYLQGWNRLGANIFIWDYVVNYGGWPMPWPNLEVIDRNIDIYAENGVRAIFLQSSHYGFGENQGRLRSWVYSQKMWDPSRKMQDLVRDFNYGYFGKAGYLMQEYSDLLLNEWKLYHKTHKLKDSTRRTIKLSDKYYSKANAIFQKALKLAADDKPLLEKIEFEYISVLFYRLEILGVIDDSDKAAYIKDLELFKELTTKYKVDWITERTTKTSARIVEWKRKYNIVSAGDKPVVMVLGAKDATKVGNGAKRYDDISAPGGMVIKLPVAGKEWAVQWVFGSALFNDTEYSVRIQIRADKKQNSGPAVGFGIYSIESKKVPLKGVIYAEDIVDGGYGWFECGNINGSDAASAYFYLSQRNDSSIKNIYITAVEFIPKGKKGFTASAKPKVHSAAPATAVVATPVPASGVVVFTADTADLRGTFRRIEGAVSVPPASKAWNGKWKIASKLPVGTYNARAYIKVTGPKAGFGVRFGIYSPLANKSLLNSISPVTGMTSGTYQWLDLGMVNITVSDPGAYLFVSSGGDNSFDSLLVKSVEFKKSM